MDPLDEPPCEGASIDRVDVDDDGEPALLAPDQLHRFARRVYGRATTQLVEVDPPTRRRRDPDAPIPLHRSGPTRMPMAASIPRARAEVEPSRDRLSALRRILDEHFESTDAIRLRLDDTRVIVTGTVRSQLQRLLVEDLVFCVPEIEDCINGLRVVVPSDHAA